MLYRTVVSLPIFSLLIMLSSITVAAGVPDQIGPDMINPGYVDKPDWFKSSFLDIREDIGEATDSGKRVLLYFYQDGCPYCAKLLRENLSQPHIVSRLRNDFDVVAINMWGDREVTDSFGRQVTEKGFATDLKVMFTPTLLFLNEAGKVVLRVNGYYAPYKFATALGYVGDKRETQQTFREYIAEVQPAPAMGKLHNQSGYVKPPYDLRAAVANSEKPLMVLFEQKQCPACDELHLDIFRRDETKLLLDSVNVVLLDMWADDSVITPDGTQTTVSKWAVDKKVLYAPSMLFFDKSGKEVFRSEAYLKSFHVQSIIDFVGSGSYREQSNFQRYIALRAEDLEAKGIHVDLMK